MRRWWYRFVLFEPTRGVAEGRLVRMQPRRRLCWCGRRARSGVLCATWVENGAGCGIWSRSSVYGGERWFKGGWAVAPVPELPESAYAVCAVQQAARCEGSAQRGG